ncbi:TPA: TRAP transporter large permease [Aeromonas veronii]|uniref:TRAP transporter large permease n=1 Tax=Aeromonas TaxID=642 RepID=UPI00330EFA30|nr:TRAP transporter large permease [Aeromonas veronii]HDO1336219.1 TRAP transporter large permease [Aeromonas veronii]HDO1340724.1 TRAP transporter large permease [Aeromonas veronii]HDO1345256.1 TRAP transporter large permease [Aeromonas veronii]HDO1349831.1 TRAP transporter large permease [Aeromonas veronii]
MLLTFITVLFGALFIGVPIGISMMLSAIVLLFTMGMFDPQIITENFTMGVNSFPLMAIPFFILTGEIMKNGGLSLRIVDFAMSIVGHIKGGLGYVVIISGLIFAGLSGSAIADTAALGAILIPMMASRGYNINTSTGIVCAVGIIAVVLPPSIPMIVFGVTAGVSITKLFMGGMVPGLLMAGALWLMWKFLYRNTDMPVMYKKSRKERWAAFKDAFWALLLPVILIVGLRGGIFTPTEAGVVAAIYAAIISFYGKGLDKATLLDIFSNTVRTTGVVMFVAAAAMVSAFAITVAQIPTEIAASLAGVTENPKVILALIMLFLLIVGCVMDLIPAILIFTPVLMPIIKMYGIEPNYFGILMVINLSVGLITPPIGTVLYVGSSISKTTVYEVSKGVFPFLMVYIALLALFIILPDVVIVPMNYFS